MKLMKIEAIRRMMKNAKMQSRKTIFRLICRERTQHYRYPAVLGTTFVINLSYLALINIKSQQIKTRSILLSKSAD